MRVNNNMPQNKYESSFSVQKFTKCDYYKELSLNIKGHVTPKCKLKAYTSCSL